MPKTRASGTPAPAATTEAKKPLPFCRPACEIRNLGSHNGKAVRRAVRGAGAKLLFLPKYSPDLNPIEQVFAKLKHWLRRAQARSVDQVNTTIGRILDRFEPDECAAYLKNAGYASA